jgi:perosamine synthetase
MYSDLIEFIRNHYQKKEGFIGLHEPIFVGNERRNVLEAIDSTFVSSVGKFVDQFEEMIRDYTGAKFAIATVNGSAALHISLLLSGVNKNDLVITQPFSFVATCNCISYVGAEPIFVDIDRNTLGLCASKLEAFLSENAVVLNGQCFHKASGKRIAACVPMHTFGHPVEIEKISNICQQFNIALIEDSAESIGSKYINKHTGTFGKFGAFSFNGNKTITCGGGGVIITDDEKLGKLAKHITTQAKVPHRWEFKHDYIGYNYRMPNINAALACAQLEKLDVFVANKRQLAKSYKTFFETTSKATFIEEPENSKSNYWLNAILLKDVEERDAFLKYTNDNGVMTRPAWGLLNKLPMFNHCVCDNIDTAIEMEARLVNIPSSVFLAED